MRMRTYVLSMFWVLSLSACTGDSPKPVTSTLITNAVIYDGSGDAPYNGAVRFDTVTQRIVAVGDIDAIPGETIIDAEGLALAPGFIDTHSHHAEDVEEFRHMPGVLSQSTVS